MFTTCYNTIICSDTVDKIYFLASPMQVIPASNQRVCFHFNEVGPALILLPCITFRMTHDILRALYLL